VGKLKVELGLEGTRFGFQFLSFEKFKFRCFKKIRKNVDVENVVLHHCVNFHIKIHCILGSVKITKSHKKTKTSFQCTVHHYSWTRKSQLIIFAKPKIQHISF
jgi:hypothetical protein